MTYEEFIARLRGTYNMPYYGLYVNKTDAHLWCFHYCYVRTVADRMLEIEPIALVEIYEVIPMITRRIVYSRAYNPPMLTGGT